MSENEKNPDLEEEIVNTETEDNVSEETKAAETETTDTENVEAENEETAGDEESQEKKSFFKKKDKKDKKDIQIEELTDKYRRTMAEFDNYRKRTDKEKTAMYEVGAREIIEKILPVVDNFERGLSTLSEEDKKTPLADGMDKIYKQFAKTLEDIGVKEIESEGVEFDPNLHNAVMHIEDDSLGENVVAEVLQKGYMYKDTVVRHSMVKVAN